MEVQNKVKPINSLRVIIANLVFAAIVVTIAISMWNVMPIMEDSMETISENYMQDVCKTKRDQLQQKIEDIGREGITTEVLASLAGDAGITGMDSSYMYIVNRDGTMLYHPTESKIGNSVENSVVLELVSEIASGQTPADGITTYNYNGESKYAVYCLTDDQIIMVLSVDRADVMEPVKYMFIRNILAGLLIIFVLMPITYFFVGGIIKPIQTLSQILIRASQLDFVYDDEIDRICKSKNEVGLIGRSTRILSLDLKKVITTIQNESQSMLDAAVRTNEAADQTTSSVEQVNTAVAEVAQGAVHQAEDTTDTKVSVEDMGDMIEVVKKEVDDVTSKSEEMLAASDSAMDTLKELRDINESVMGQIVLVADQTKETNQSVQKIQSAAKMITEIADETNLLSLNASIEAARAGEAGKGFAVVADQIGQLSEQSNQSAKEIQEIVDRLISDSAKSVEAMEHVRVDMEEQSQKVMSTDENFNAVKKLIDSSNKNIGEIDAKTSEINEHRYKIVDIISSLSSIAEENAASSEETSAAIEEVRDAVEIIHSDSSQLQDIAETINENMSKFQF